VRECVAHLARYAKSSGTVIVLVGHVTKEGAIAARVWSSTSSIGAVFRRRHPPELPLGARAEKTASAR